MISRASPPDVNFPAATPHRLKLRLSSALSTNLFFSGLPGSFSLHLQGEDDSTPWRSERLSNLPRIPMGPISTSLDPTRPRARRLSATIPTASPSSPRITSIVKATARASVAHPPRRARADNRRSPSPPSRVSSITRQRGTMPIQHSQTGIGARYRSGSWSARMICSLLTSTRGSRTLQMYASGVTRRRGVGRSLILWI